MKRWRALAVAAALVGLVVAGAVMEGPTIVRRVSRRRALARALAALEAEDAIRHAASKSGVDRPWDPEPARALVAFD